MLIADSSAAIISSLKNWASRPFREEMNLMDWALFTGLIVALVIMWNMVLRDLKGE